MKIVSANLGQMAIENIAPSGANGQQPNSGRGLKMSTPAATETAVSGNVGTWQMSTPDGTETAVCDERRSGMTIRPIIPLNNLSTILIMIISLSVRRGAF